ncbi:UDPglucose--hexose-1-phosphate uridylyltransferase [Sanguibacter gelidistatuariae]|uniref:Galactose-1-phosphate uridylyltransferase n=2 Tax=Sanguibacter gelidistatuariae TaxID=1814289 RepID=A0A1G6HMK8_9MICO|nr:galactose-1-phosphate uridylyltransferase [Sanguibacter gelidistatuariae]SDB95383.1 UDPglucose--hexose-1-phosphate uridylyltransferase [Sanguibacter gelidistatuariae]
MSTEGMSTDSSSTGTASTGSQPWAVPAVRRTHTTLADGRDLFYFDDSEPYVSGKATRRLDDPRPLPGRFEAITTTGPDGEPVTAPVTGPTMRLDVLTGEWIPHAAHRMNRTFLPAADSNPLAPAKPGAAYSDGEIPAEDYDVVVFENRFPSLMRVPGTVDEVTALEGEDLWKVRPAVGRCEVICFSPDSDKSLAQVGPRRMRTIIEAWADRTTELGKVDGVEQVFCFENRGKEIGVTLSHPHGQIYAYPYLMPKTDVMLRQARAHRAGTGRNLLRDVLDAELRSGRRIIAQSAHWVAYVPAAARWPIEVHLAPRRDVADLPALSDAERADLALVYLELLGRMDRFFPAAADGRPTQAPYIAAWHQAPVREGRDDLRLHLQLFSILRAPGKLKYLAGSESGGGAWISDTTPERIADRLAEVASPTWVDVTADAPADVTVPADAGDHA